MFANAGGHAAAPADHPSGTIRKLWLGESAALREHLLRLDPESRRYRFGSAVNTYFIDQYASRALTPDTVVHGYFVDGVLRAVAELRPYGKPFAREAEAAFSVEREWQSHGVGNDLMERMILAARNCGIRAIHLNCLTENHRMQAIARKHDAHLHFHADDVVGELVNPGATPLSVVREFIADGHGIANAILDLQSRMLRAA
ncbi:MAG: GNAT family N-acetyltransferase [Bradyrhizobiaceae bacterium]|nr:GNAT family N-acetyltransferase [Bradyrhizobiaceae bacterium]